MFNAQVLNSEQDDEVCDPSTLSRLRRDQCQGKLRRYCLITDRTPNGASQGTIICVNVAGYIIIIKL
jgi:hypothetical protein